ncbi:oligosaccharide flippase family protein [candidate division KSB1 bacterium]
MKTLKDKLYKLLLWSERYTKTDMLYLAKGGFWLMFGQIIVTTSGLILAIGFANLLPKDVYGNYKFILSLAGIIGAFTLTGMGTAVTRAVAQGYDGMLRLGFWTSLKWSILIFIAGLACSIYYFLNENITIAVSMLIAGSFSPFLLSFTLYSSFLHGKKDFKQDAIFNITRNIIPVTSLITALFFTKNPILLILIYFSSHTITAGLLYLKTLHKYNPSNEIDAGTINYGKHLSVMNVLGVVAMNIDKVLVFHYLGAVELAIYAFATVIPEQIKTSIKTVGSLAFPKFSQKTSSEIKETIVHKTIKLGLLITAIVIIYILIAPFIYKILFPQYIESIFYSQLLAISLIAGSAILPITALQSQAEKDKLYKINVYTSIFQIIILFILINLYGLIGVIVARIMTRILSLGLSISLIKRTY